MPTPNIEDVRKGAAKIATKASSSCDILGTIGGMNLNVDTTPLTKNLKLLVSKINKIYNDLSSVIDDIQQKIIKILDKIQTVATDVMNLVTTTINNVTNAIAETLTRVISKIGDALSVVDEQIKNILGGLSEAIDKSMVSSCPIVSDAFKTVAGGAVDLLSSMEDSVASSFSGVGDALTSQLNLFKSENPGSLSDGFKKTIDDIFGNGTYDSL